MLGTIYTLASFPFLFLPAIGFHVDVYDESNLGVDETIKNLSKINATSILDNKYGGDNEMSLVIYYSTFTSIYAFGWATVQISHLSMIPELTPDDNVRMELTSMRHTATVGSNILVFCTVWLLDEIRMCSLIYKIKKSKKVQMIISNPPNS